MQLFTILALYCAATSASPVAFVSPLGAGIAVASDGLFHHKGPDTAVASSDPNSPEDEKDSDDDHEVDVRKGDDKFEQLRAVAASNNTELKTGKTHYS